MAHDHGHSDNYSCKVVDCCNCPIDFNTFLVLRCSLCPFFVIIIMVVLVILMVQTRGKSLAEMILVRGVGSHKRCKWVPKRLGKTWNIITDFSESKDTSSLETLDHLGGLNFALEKLLEMDLVIQGAN